ncbi:MAG: class I SAM-dependent methyltransferase [Gammaproteobacteria bacterium]|jgi:2-polyprenyl-3-methyl-5-hydroxy-6-metoxy-1,4-benzoquinol methylase
MTQPASSPCPICDGRGEHDFSSTDLMFGGSTLYDYHRCTRCGLIYQHPIPDPETIAGFYPDSYSIYREPSHPRFSKGALLTLKSALGYRHLAVEPAAGLLERLRRPRVVPEVVPYVPRGRALDIGCGNGEYLLRLESIGWQCQGVEFNDKAVSICRANGLDVFQGELKAAAFPSGRFDFVTANHLIEHVPAPHELMSEIARITKAGGKVLIRTPNSESLARSWFGVYWFANEVPRHLMLYSAHNLRMLAAAHGLAAESISTPVKPKLLLRSLDYRLGNRAQPSEQRKILKWMAKLYAPAARLRGRGDELFALFSKG